MGVESQDRQGQGLSVDGAMRCLSKARVMSVRIDLVLLGMSG